jgi:hypothetical protein
LAHRCAGDAGMIRLSAWGVFHHVADAENVKRKAVGEF